MTEMPELVAILHSFVGLAAVLVGFNSYLYHEPGLEPILVNIHLTEVFLGIFIGAVTFTGSIVAFGKLRGKISSKPLMLPNRHKLNLAALVVSFVLLVVFVRTESVGLQVLALLVMTIIALAFGWHLVASIGGADMPVVVHAELLLRLGGGGGRLYAEQRPADRHRCAGGFFRCDPVLHHV
jgi:NAD(P) transhydrogenase subunit beta